jgi:hypothetical protein
MLDPLFRKPKVGGSTPLGTANKQRTSWILLLSPLV